MLTIVYVYNNSPKKNKKKAKKRKNQRNDILI